MVKVNIDGKIKIKLGSLRLGLLHAKIITCSDSSEKLLYEIEKSSQYIKNNYKLDEISKKPIINATRTAYRKAGNDPNRYRPSADSLLRRIVKGNNLYRVNNIVDTLNLISIQSGYSIGGYDAEKIKGDICLGIGRKEEPYKGIGRGQVNIDKLIVLRDSIGAFGTPTSDSERTMITENTVSILWVFYDFGIDASLSSYMTKSETYLKMFSAAKNITIKMLKF
ncbi:MAG: hypothetical protein JW894_09030 [Bacteroidales bacterium]|nr:hypothetical protein [Bacteroidales bacterium]